jgi:alcohol-forming fatty acyl-CoA reductase
VLKSRWDAVLREPDNPLGVRASRAFVHGLEEALDLLPDKLRTKIDRVSRRLREMDSDLAQIEKLVDLYLPFMYESFYVFESRALDAHPPLEPEFRFEPEKLDWRRYWLDIHMPGLRRWAFPLIEGRRPERYRCEHAVRLASNPPQLTAADELAGQLASATEV